jgi:four helix bundle protein
MKNNGDNIILERSFEFALKIVDLYKIMIKQNEYVISKQLLKSGTSIGANVHEAQAAQSKKDFSCKMAIASKEARETQYWLLLINKSKIVNKIENQVSDLLSEINEIIHILTKIVKTSQK